MDDEEAVVANDDEEAVVVNDDEASLWNGFKRSRRTSSYIHMAWIQALAHQPWKPFPNARDAAITNDPAPARII